MVGCASGKYQSGGRCHLCDHTCAACVDAGPANCTSCDTGEYEMSRSRSVSVTWCVQYVNGNLAETLKRRKGRKNDI